MLATRVPEAESLMQASTVSRTIPGQQHLSKGETAVVEIVSGDPGKDNPSSLPPLLFIYKVVDIYLKSNGRMSRAVVAVI